MHPIPLKIALAAALWAGFTGAFAHDTWFERLVPAKSGEPTLALGTGNRFPVHQFTVSTTSLLQNGCRGSADGAKTVPLKTVRETAKALILRVPLKLQGAVTCWAQQTPFEVEIAPATVQVYFQEINAPAAARAAWDEMRSRGVTWKERYAKHARIELRGKDVASRAATAQPAGMAMDVLLDSGLQAIRANDTVAFQVLRDGQPLPELAVELRSDVSPIGFWRKTDAQGRVNFQVPVPGNWVLRGTDLRVSATAPDTWDSRFVTLAFEVLPAPR